MTRAPDIRDIRNEVREYLDAGEVRRVAELISTLHPADGAEVLSEFNPEIVQRIMLRLPPEQGAELLVELDQDYQVRVAGALSPSALSEMLELMAPDDVADVLGELEPQQAQAALADLKEGDEIRELLGYDEDSAGGLMSSHIITLRSTLTANDAIGLLRRLKPEEEDIYYLFVVEDGNRLIGVVSLRQLIVADPATPITEIMRSDVVVATVDTDQEECARLLSRYDLLALPIIDHDSRIVGAITADDIIDVIEEEATEDIYRLANLDAEEDVEDTLLRSARRRLFWLLVNLPTAVLAGWVAGQFDSTVGKVTALVSFMPIVAGMGGNAGIQTLTLIVRSLGLGEIGPGDGLRALGRELSIGAINGITFGCLLALLGMVWHGSPVLGLVVGAAMVLNLLVAAIAGSVVPLVLRLLRVDPALASGVLVTTVTDVTGYTCLLGLATLFISQLERLAR